MFKFCWGFYFVTQVFSPLYERLDQIVNNFPVSALVSNGKLPLRSQWKKDKTDCSVSIIVGIVTSLREASVLTIWGAEYFIRWPWFSCSLSAAL